MQLLTAATTGLTVDGTEFVIPGVALPENPDNIDRPMVVNTAGEPSIEYKGKKTPTIRIIAVPKANWYTVNFMTSLIVGLTAAFDTGDWAIGLHDTSGWRVYDNCRCERVILTGAPTLRSVIMDFKAIYGENEAASPTAFVVPSATTGQAIKAVQCGWTSATADMVREWGLVIERDQAWDMNADETNYAAAIRSGPLRFALSLGQDPDAANVPSASDTASGTVVLNTGASGAGIKYTLKVSRDSSSTPHTPSIVTATRSYGGIDLGDGAGMLTLANV